MMRARRARPGISPFAWSGSLYYGLYYLCAGSYAPFLYVYFSDLGLSGKQVGLLATLAPIVTLLLSSLVASLADRTRKRVRITQAALACTAVVVFLLRLPSTFGHIALLMLFLAVFSSPLASISEGLIARMAHRNRLNYGGMRLWGSLGWAVSALGCGFLWQALGFRVMFLVAGVLYLPLIFIAGRLEEGPVVPAQERRPASQLLRDRGLLLLLVATFLAGVSNTLAMVFQGIYARSLGGGNVLIGAMAAGGALAELPVMFYSSRISQRVGGANAVIYSCVVMALAYLGYELTKSPDLLVGLSVLKGFGYGLWFTVTIRLLTKRTPEEWASTAQSLLTICLFGLAPLVAGPIGGWIHDTIGPSAVFGLAAASMGMAGVVMLLARRLGKLA
jgi:PPP family 3-phenylpropionic acid transporter